MNLAQHPAILHYCMFIIKRKLHGVAHLASKRFIKLEGLDAPKFLQGLTTNNIEKLNSASTGQYSALLNAQGRMMYDIFIYKGSADQPLYYLECDGQIQERVFLHLQTYNLRTRAKIELVSDDLTVAFSSIPLEGSEASLKDSRTDWSFSRHLFKSHSDLQESIKSLPTFTEGRYHRERIFKGVPEGAFEIASRQAAPMEFNVDLMGGIDFNKGCYLGQELVTRTHHRGVVRKRILPLRFHSLNSETGKPVRIDPFELDLSSKLTVNLDKQSEFLPTSLDSDGKLQITSKSDGVGKHFMSQGNIGLGMMRLDVLYKDESSRTNLATLDHIESDWILADALIPEWWPRSTFNNL